MLPLHAWAASVGFRFDTGAAWLVSPYSLPGYAWMCLVVLAWAAGMYLYLLNMAASLLRLRCILERNGTRPADEHWRPLTGAATFRQQQKWHQL